MIQVGGTITAACAPNEHGSSICCSMKHVTLLWYCTQTEKQTSYTHKYIYILYNTKTTYTSWETYCLFAPGAADGYNLFTVKGKLLLKPLQTEIKEHVYKLYNSVTNVQFNISYDIPVIMFYHKTPPVKICLPTFPHCLHLPSCLLRWTQWCRTTAGCHKNMTQDFIKNF